MTLLVSSHILSELEEYSTDMLVLRSGRIIEHASLTGNRPGTFLEIRLAAPHGSLRDLLASRDNVANLCVSDDQATFSFSMDPAEQHRLLKELLDRGAPICSFSEQRQNLQETYLKTVKNEGMRGRKK